ncbi:hypothetical protein ACOMHN_017572 [Nucella lapillus]
MDPDSIFKRFFGVSFPEIDQRRFRPVEEDEAENSWLGDARRHGTNLFHDWQFRHQQQQEMFELQQQIEEAFRFFSIPHYDPAAVPILPDGSGETESKPDSGSAARDAMLKEEREWSQRAQSPEQPVETHPFPGAMFSPWLEEFTGTPRLNRIPPRERKDQDIDSESPGKEEIVDMYHQSRAPFQYFFGRGGTVNMRTLIGSNGVVEERSTRKDSSGHEETTVTRRMGDQAHTVTVVKDGKGQEEKRETFQNIDENKVSEFEQRWQGKGRVAEPAIADCNTAVQSPQVPGGALSDDRGFFRKFFGF